MTKISFPLRRLALSAAGLLLLASCTTNPATGEREFTPFMSPSQEAAIGAEQHPQLMQEFGGEYDDAALAAYVRQVGGELAARSELPNLDFTFTVVNSKIVNAFALPGGYVYVSRGLMALFNDEAELASVVGHEIGHVTARHAANRYNRSIFAGLGAAVVGAVSGSPELAGLLGQGSQLYLLSYSRGQESEADMLGQRYMVRTGYDPKGAVRMLLALDRDTKLEAQISGTSANQTPSWARTHPYASDRAVAASQRVADLPPEQQTGALQRDRFLDHIDGMLYGDDPAQGIISGQTFTHPTLRITFTAPDGYALRNTAEAVVGAAENGKFLLTAGQISAQTPTADFLRAEWRRIAGDQAPALSNLQAIRGDGLERLTATTVISGSSGNVAVRLVAIRQTPTQAYMFTLLWPAGAGSGVESGLVAMVNGFRGISEAEADEVRPQILRVVTVRAGDTATSLSRNMPFGSYNLAWFKVLNALGDDAALSVGQRVKIVTDR